jgi:hypothetical protein
VVAWPTNDTKLDQNPAAIRRPETLNTTQQVDQAEGAGHQHFQTSQVSLPPINWGAVGTGAAAVCTGMLFVLGVVIELPEEIATS